MEWHVWVLRSVTDFGFLDATRYIQKFYQMRTQLQAVALRIQTVRSNEQMMQSMKGATSLLGSMNRSMNLPALQRIAMEFEKENDIMDQRQEMMDDAIDDVTGLEDEEEGEEVVREVLDEIGIDLGQAVCSISLGFRGGKRSMGIVDELGRRWMGAMLDCAHLLTLFRMFRWARPPQACRRLPWRMGGSRRRLAGVEEVERAETMIYRPGLIASGDSWACSSSPWQFGVFGVRILVG